MSQMKLTIRLPSGSRRYVTNVTDKNISYSIYSTNALPAWASWIEKANKTLCRLRLFDKCSLGSAIR